MSSLHTASTPVPYTHSLRVTLILRAGRVELASVMRVPMRAPASAATLPKEGSSGFWFELRSNDGKVLYHRPLRNPIEDSLEVFDDPQGGTIRRVPVNRTQSTLDVIVPDLPDAAEFMLYGSSGKSDKKRGARRPSDTRKASELLIRRSIDELRREAAGKGSHPSRTNQGDREGSNGGTLR